MGRRKKQPGTKHRFARVLLAAAALTTGYGVLFHRALIEAHLTHIGVAAGLVALLWLIRLFKRLRLASTLSEIDAMGGHEFERYLVRLFRRLGYRAENVGGNGGDFGADLILEKDGVKIAVQAKNYTCGRVGNDAVQQAIAGATYYDCQEAMVVTNARFTRAAKEQAGRCSVFPVTLWNRNDLKQVLGDR